jgi:alpha-D-ribose 1-methylphosphonate 5-triphosphate synthase subunit PhnG
MHDMPGSNADRREWMGLLARAPLEMLESWAVGRGDDFIWLRRPEAGLAMVRARIGATGDRFNLGEVTVTRCTLRLSSGQHGVAYVQGRSSRKAELAALVDALMQEPMKRAELERDLLQPLRARVAKVRAAVEQEATLTRVDFLTVSRGDE